MDEAITDAPPSVGGFLDSASGLARNDMRDACGFSFLVFRFRSGTGTSTQTSTIAAGHTQRLGQTAELLHADDAHQRSESQDDEHGPPTHHVQEGRDET